jgi:hypothetical protein
MRKVIFSQETFSIKCRGTTVKEKPVPDLTDPERRISEMIDDHRRYFWDKEALDLARDKFIIIERILELGTEDEVDAILAYYGRESVAQVVRKSRELSPRTVNYFIFLLGMSRGETRCFSDVSHRIWQPY